MTEAPLSGVARGADSGSVRVIAKPAQTPRRAEVRSLLAAYHANHDPALRERLVELNVDLVHYVARRFANRGEPLEDLEQVGFLGLIHAIERFDPSLGYEFSTFATPTIMGEIRRHFRDKSWAVRVPRRLQETYLRVAAVREQLNGALGRSPSVDEIAEVLAIEPNDVLAALEVSPAQNSLSLDRPLGGTEGDGAAMGDIIGVADENLDRVEARQLLDRVMAHLTNRERSILAMRFVDELSQVEVAKRLGISQMHVSRLQRAAIDHLRSEFADEVAEAGPEMEREAKIR